MLKINLDGISKRDIANSIANQIITAIAVGDLRKGDVLPSERTLSESLGVSRGTINKVYSCLKSNRYIISKIGSHHYVAGIESLEESKREKGHELTNRYIDSMRELNYTFSEIRATLNLSIIKREGSTDYVKMAVIECRPDAIYVFKKRLESIPNLKIYLFLLDDVLNIPSKVEEIMQCDIILSTSAHYFEVCKNFPQLSPNIVEVVTVLSENTVFQLASIPHNARIGIVYSSPRTIELIQTTLQYFNIKYETLSAFNETSLKTFDDFCASKTVLIAEPLSVIFDESRNQSLLKDFFQRGGKTILFDHSIDKGSMLIIEQSILKAMNKKKNPHSFNSL